MIAALLFPNTYLPTRVQHSLMVFPPEQHMNVCGITKGLVY